MASSLFGLRPDLMEAALSANAEIGLRSACHHAQLNVGEWNVLKSARAGLTTMEHWYDCPRHSLRTATCRTTP